MKLTSWFLNFDFSSRARRSHYWANWACWTAIIVGIVVAGAELGSSAAKVALSASLFLALVLATIDGIAVTFRRAHDTGRSGWIWVLLLVPVVNLLPLYWLLIEDSQQGPNKYGPPVKAFYEPGVARPAA
jgi:uncharacterized membrane protein YhaH (DUF805 family)